MVVYPHKNLHTNYSLYYKYRHELLGMEKMVKRNKNEGEKMKKILMVILTGFLIMSLGLIESAENPKRTKEFYRGPKDRPTMHIWFFDDPESSTKGWMAQAIEYKILNKTIRAADLQYLDRKQRQDKNTIIVTVSYDAGYDTELDDNYSNTLVTIIYPWENSEDYPLLYYLRGIELQSKYPGEGLYFQVNIYDSNSDGHPDYCARGPIPENRLLNPPKGELFIPLFYDKVVTKIEIKCFKFFKKELGYKKIEKEFQKWLKENKQ